MREVFATEFLPYLWGIETRNNLSEQFPCLLRFYPTYEALKQRNGTIWYWYTTEFLPYLWGIETDIVARFEKQLNKFLPYLWGIETL